MQVEAPIRAAAPAKRGAGFIVCRWAAEPMRTPPKRAPSRPTRPTAVFDASPVWIPICTRTRSTGAAHPEDDMTQPLTGVFSTCSPNRPNPIGLHRARIVAREGLRIEVDALEAIDGTPVVDVKPAIDPSA